VIKEDEVEILERLREGVAAHSQTGPNTSAIHIRKHHERHTAENLPRHLIQVLPTHIRNSSRIDYRAVRVHTFHARVTDAFTAMALDGEEDLPCALLPDGLASRAVLDVDGLDRL
jgi:hypothetical protein